MGPTKTARPHAEASELGATVEKSIYTSPNSFPGLVGFLACLEAGWVFLNPLVSFPLFPGLVGERIEDSRHFSVQVP